MRSPFTSLLVLMVAGCVSAEKAGSSANRLVKAGDCLVIRSETRSTPEIRRVVGSDGCIELPVAEKVSVAGLPLIRVARTLEERYQPTELPELTLSVTRCQD